MRITGFIILFWVVLGSCFTGYCRERHVEIATGVYPPWVSEDVPHGGYVNHIIVEAFGRKGYTVSFHYYPWERAYNMARQGRHHATSFWADSPETRKKHAAYFFKSEPVMYAKVVFFHLKENPMQPWQTLGDLKGYRIGTMIGETSTQILKQHGLVVHDVGKAGQVFSMILNRRLDIFPLELLTGLDILYYQFGPDQSTLFSYDPKPMFETPASLLFSKDHQQGDRLVAVFNQGLAQLEQEGVRRKLYQDLVAGKYSKFK
ncbi:MAG: hypothetical protein D3926_15970 [Desulfobacteraceae bacterium]|nr:MAG: hypothetical protein D3926_15970 [Desulfobacteraceae bacterium]